MSRKYCGALRCRLVSCQQSLRPKQHPPLLGHAHRPVKMSTGTNMGTRYQEKRRQSQGKNKVITGRCGGDDDGTSQVGGLLRTSQSVRLLARLKKSSEIQATTFTAITIIPPGIITGNVVKKPILVAEHLS
ncbi:hypothetical protein TcWFU_002985 [Taenia crassiceps]|uniref:Uncharacterized protein n=1 Tax=Taenia crassiceps TaxID=6207 RepID=A0ABR4QG99_9CEST